MRRIAHSFKFAYEGVMFCIKNERNFRVHLCVAFYVAFFSIFYDFSIEKRLFLLLAVCSVIICEMFNTALEQSINLACREINPIAKIAKDVSAGAVLISATCAAIAGIMLFWDVTTITKIATLFTSQPLWLGILALSGFLVYRFVK